MDSHSATIVAAKFEIWSQALWLAIHSIAVPLVTGAIQLTAGLIGREFLPANKTKVFSAAADTSMDRAPTIQRRDHALSTSGITSSLFSSIASSSTKTNQFATDLNQLAKDLQSGSVSSAEEDYVTLSQDAQNGTTASTATTSSSGITASLLKEIAASSTSSSSFVSELSQLGSDLGNNNLQAAQQDMLSLDSTALNAATSSSSSTTATGNSAKSKELIQTIVQAMDAGNNSLVGSAMSELATVSTSASGASLLSQNSEGYSSTSSGTSSSNSISELLNSASSSSSNSSASIVSLLA
jgi:hypothetical protein